MCILPDKTRLTPFMNSEITFIICEWKRHRTTCLCVRRQDIPEKLLSELYHPPTEELLAFLRSHVAKHDVEYSVRNGIHAATVESCSMHSREHVVLLSTNLSVFD